MHDVGIRCVDMTLGLLRFQLHFTCSATLFLSFEVRACCESAVDFTGKKVVSVVVILKSKSPVISTCLSKESALLGVFRLLGCSRRAPSAALRLLTMRLRMNWIASRNQTFRFVPQPVDQTQCPSTSTSRRPSLKRPCRLQSCPVQELSST